MNKPSALVAVVVALMGVGCAEDVTQPPAPPSASVGAAQQDSPRDILYAVSAQASAAQRGALQRVVARYGVARKNRLVDGAVEHASIRSRNGRSEEQIVDELMATGAVEFAEVDALVAPDGLPNDPYYSNQWHHATMQLPSAWDRSTGSATVLAAICDQGVELTHPDLAANIAGPGYNVVDGTSDGGPATSVSAHGTRVAGLIGAVGNNDLGVVGVNWTVRILSIRITNRDDGLASISAMAACVDYARSQGARVVNISYSGARTSSAVNLAGQKLMTSGGLLFASGGNDNINMRDKNYPGIIVVGGSDRVDAKASFSNYGKPIDLVAPAVDIATTRFSTNVNGPYVFNESGTSFAAPLAAGVAALIWSYVPSLSPATVQSILFATAKDLGPIGYDATFGYGRVDAAAALTKAATYR